jgi:hypothetical protein
VLAHIWIELEYQTLYMPTLIIITLTDWRYRVYIVVIGKK